MTAIVVGGCVGTRLGIGVGVVGVVVIGLGVGVVVIGLDRAVEADGLGASDNGEFDPPGAQPATDTAIANAAAVAIVTIEATDRLKS